MTFNTLNAGMTAVVTGGAQGLGLSIARELGAFGFNVWIWDKKRPPSTLTDSFGFCEVDVTDYASVVAAVKQTSVAKPISALVNNAGVLGPICKVMDYDIAAWRKIIDVNLTGAFLCCRGVAPAMKLAGFGRIVNVASIAGKHSNANGAAYGASKAGLISFTKSLSRELARNGILVNCITPSVVDTGIFDHMDEDTRNKIRNALIAKAPIGRMLEAVEVATMVRWLCSHECTYSTGAIFDLSGGRSEY